MAENPGGAGTAHSRYDMGLGSRWHCQQWGFGKEWACEAPDSGNKRDQMCRRVAQAMMLMMPP